MSVTVEANVADNSRSLVRSFTLSRVRSIVVIVVCVHVNLMKMPRRMSRSCNVHVHRIDMRVAYNDVVAWSNDSLELLWFNLTLSI